MPEVGQWGFLVGIPLLFGALMFLPLYAAGHRTAGAALLLVTLLAMTAGLLTAALLTESERRSWVRIGLSACAVSTNRAEDLLAASGAPVLVAEDTWAAVPADPFPGRVVVFGTGPRAGQECDSLEERDN